MMHYDKFLDSLINLPTFDHPKPKPNIKAIEKARKKKANKPKKHKKGVR